MTTFNLKDITDYMETFLEAEAGTLGINYVQYGGDPIDGGIPEVPAVIIEPGVKERTLSGTGHQTTNRFVIALFVYHTSIEGVEAIQKAADELTEALETAINTECLPAARGGTKFNDLLTHGYVTDIQYGFFEMADKIMRVNRITFQGLSKTGLI